MGYISQDIAVITEPGKISLSGAGNFVTFASKPFTPVLYKASLAVLAPSVENGIIRIATPSGAIYSVSPTDDASLAFGNTYYCVGSPSEICENLRGALLSIDWIADNYELSIPFTMSGSTPVNGSVLYITSKGAGSSYNAVLSAPLDTAHTAFTVTLINPVSSKSDSISGDSDSCTIELDMYADPAILLGADDKPDTPEKLGDFVGQLNKTYNGNPVWFDVNGLFSGSARFNKPPVSIGWFDAGTARPFRFIAKVRAATSFAFYYSNALWNIAGTARASNPIDLTSYMFDHNRTIQLTNRPLTRTTRNGRAYINFIFADPRGATPDYDVSVVMRAYSQSGAYLGRLIAHDVSRNDLSTVNTCLISFADILDMFTTAARIGVCLSVGDADICDMVYYDILPDCLHSSSVFTFLNRLGGWDSFDFLALPSSAIKPEVDTYRKTVTPTFEYGDSIDTTANATISESLTIEGIPVSDDVAEWLKELATSPAIYDSEGRYVVIDDFTLPVSDTTRNMQVPTLKYHLSDNYTND